jgi:hypothetical protein
MVVIQIKWPPPAPVVHAIHPEGLLILEDGYQTYRVVLTLIVPEA